MSSSEEIFDIVDEHDRVVAQAPRSVVHARGHLHRAVSIFVFDGRGRLLVQRRSACKDEFPLRFTSSASGHLSAGEDYDPAAARELEEELGLRSPIERLQKFPASPDTANEHTVLYRTISDESPVLDPGEIESARFRELDDVAREIEADPDQFTPPFRVLFDWYVRHRREE